MLHVFSLLYLSVFVVRQHHINVQVLYYKLWLDCYLLTKANFILGLLHWDNEWNHYTIICHKVMIETYVSNHRWRQHKVACEMSLKLNKSTHLLYLYLLYQGPLVAMRIKMCLTGLKVEVAWHCYQFCKTSYGRVGWLNTWTKHVPRTQDTSVRILKINITTSFSCIPSLQIKKIKQKKNIQTQSHTYTSEITPNSPQCWCSCFLCVYVRGGGKHDITLYIRGVEKWDRSRDIIKSECAYNLVFQKELFCQVFGFSVRLPFKQGLFVSTYKVILPIWCQSRKLSHL